MGNIGSKTTVVNAGRLKWYYSNTSNEFVNLVRKRVEYHTPQKRLPISGGNIYYTMKSNNRFSVTVAYDSGEIGVGIPTSFDNWITAAAATAEVPTNAFLFVSTDFSGSNKTFTINAKITDFVSYGEAEGETLIDITFQIVDDSPSISP